MFGNKHKSKSEVAGTTVPFSTHCTVRLECLLFVFVFYILFCKNCYKPITVQYSIANCASSIPKLTLLDLQTGLRHVLSEKSSFMCRGLAAPWFHFLHIHTSLSSLTSYLEETKNYISQLTLQARWPLWHRLCQEDALCRPLEWRKQHKTTDALEEMGIPSLALGFSTVAMMAEVLADVMSKAMDGFSPLPALILGYGASK